MTPNDWNRTPSFAVSRSWPALRAVSRPWPLLLAVAFAAACDRTPAAPTPAPGPAPAPAPAAKAAPAPTQTPAPTQKQAPTQTQAPSPAPAAPPATSAPPAPAAPTVPAAPPATSAPPASSAPPATAAPAASGDLPVVREWKETFPNGKLKTLCPMVRHPETGKLVKHGIWRTWNQDGSLNKEGMYVLGVQDGVWKFWYPGVAQPITETFKMGVKVSDSATPKR